MKKHATLALLALLPMQASSTEVSFDTLFVDIDFVRTVHCEISPLHFDFGNIMVGGEYTMTAPLVGDCSRDVRAMIYPIDRGDLFTNVEESGIKYSIKLNPLNDEIYKNNTTLSHCNADSDVLKNIDENGCHFRIDTKQTGVINESIEATITILSNDNEDVVKLLKTIPLEVMVTFDE